MVDFKYALLTSAAPSFVENHTSYFLVDRCHVIHRRNCLVLRNGDHKYASEVATKMLEQVIVVRITLLWWPGTCARIAFA